MRDTQTIANRLAERHTTRNPIQISKELGYIIIDTPLYDIRGVVGCSCETVAKCLGVTYELAQYHIGTIKRSSLSTTEFVD